MKLTAFVEPAERITFARRLLECSRNREEVLELPPAFGQRRKIWLVRPHGYRWSP